MTRDEIISKYVSDPEYKKICAEVAGNYGDDLYQDLTLVILELPDEKLQHLNESCFKCYFYQVARNQYNSTTSAFHKRYRKDYYVAKEHRLDIIQAAQPTIVPVDAKLVGKVYRAMEEIHWYDAGILNLYMEKGTFKAVAEATGIPAISVFRTVANTKKIINKKIKKYG